MRFTLFIFALLVARNAGATDPSLAALCREHYRLVGNATVPDRDGQPSSTQRANEWVGRFVKLVNAEAAATAPALASANRFGGMPFRADPAGGGHVLDFATGGQTGTPPPNYYPALKERLAFLEWKLTYEYTSVEASVVTEPAEIRRLLESPGYRISQRQLGRRGFVGLIAGAVVGAVAGASRTTSSILHERQAILDETVAGMKKNLVGSREEHVRLLEEFLKLKRKELAVPKAPPGPAQYERYHARRAELLRELEVKLAAYARERKEKDSEPANVRQSVDDEREQMVRHLKSTLRLEFPTAARFAGEEDTRLETIETRVRNHIEWLESMHGSGVKLPFGARRDEYAELHRLFNADNFDNAAGLTERLERMARRDPGLINSESVLSAATVRNKNPEGFREFLYKNNYPFFSDYELRDVDARLTGSTSPERVLIPTPLHIGALAAFFGAAAEGGDFAWAQAGRYRKPRSPAPELKSLRDAAAGFGRDDGARLHWAGTTDTRGDSTDVFLFVDNRTGKMVLVAARYEIPEEHRRIRHDGVPELLAKRAEDARAAVPPPPPPTVRSPTEIGKIRDHLEASLFSAPDAPTAPLHALFRRIEKIPFSDKQFGDLKGALARVKGERDLDSVRRLLDEMEKTNAK